MENPFSLSSFLKGEIPYERDDYFDNIMTKTSDYALDHLEELSASFLAGKNIKR